ncbi:MAG: fused MFS/spermidine synthase [Vulcanimicrobiaceae bacterium]
MLFIVEPMFAKMVIPLLGGSSEVWTACVLFYQFILLAGYAYAHVLRRLPDVRQQILVHGTLCALAALALPLGIRAGTQPPDAGHALPWLLSVVVLSVGAPFFVLAATSPLLQAWLGDARTGADPYPLYAASNAGSLLALASYPFLIEPVWGLRLQSLAWSAGYAVFAILLAVCAVAAWNGARSNVRPASAQAAEPLAFRRRLRWIALAFIPSSLMLSVTSYISERVAPLPLLWTLPLGIYLASFIVVFARRWRAPLLPDRAAALLLAPLIAMLATNLRPSPLIDIPLHLALFATLAIVSHGALAADRPAASQLTEFYCYLGVGGFLGGVFNGALAPLIFPDIYEYPIVLVLAALTLRARTNAHSARVHRNDVILPVGLAASLAIVSVLARSGSMPQAQLSLTVAFFAAAVVCFSFSTRPARFAAGLCAIFLVGEIGNSPANVDIERNFYGVKTVRAVGDATHVLVHGHTVHGSERLGGPRERLPTTYYARTGPLGDITVALAADRRPVAVVGLGVGTAACYRQPGQAWTFYEIDPGMVAIARNRRLFRYLDDCAPREPVIVGDGRVELAKAAPHRYGLIIMDAYSADSIPTHLLTREALRLYESRLAPGGVIAFHITNEYFTFGPLIAALARDGGLISRTRADNGPGGALPNYAKAPSRWVAVARRTEDLRALAHDPRWIETRPAGRVWTDDYSSIVTVLKR